MTERVQQIQEMGDEGKHIYPMDYVISQDGGTTWIDGFDRWVCKIVQRCMNSLM